jgi:RNA polymerase sigma-70 factor (ECF subfamily)
MTAALSLPLPFLVDNSAAMSDAGPNLDEQLVQATLSGDDGAFAELVRRHKRKVFGTASRFARNDHQLEDIAQEVFIRAYKNLSQFRKDAPFEHWLARITFSACYDFLRRERKHRETAPLDAVDFDLYDNSVDQAVAAGRAREVLAWAMRHLRADEQLVLTLCEIEERTIREVADLTGWSESNVKVRAFRARQALKRILEEHAER